MRKLSLLVALLMLVALVPHAAAQDNDSPSAYVRFAYLVPGADQVAVTVDNQPLDTAMSPDQAISDWQQVSAGAHDVSVAPSGQAQSDSIAALQDLNLPADSWTTVLVSQAPDGSIAAAPITEDLSVMSPGVARITFVNALSQDVQVNFLRDGAPFVTQLAPIGSASGLGSSSTVSVDAGTFTLTASATQDPEQVFAEQQDVEIDEATAYLVVLAGDRDASLIVDSTDRATYQLLTGALEEPGTIIQAAQANDELGPWLDAVEQAGLTDLLSGDGPYTVFAPAGFTVDEIMNQVGGDNEALADWLRGHIVEGNLQSQDVINSSTLTALNGDTLDITVEPDTAFVNGAEILAVNIPATNGTIHIIGQEPPG